MPATWSPAGARAVIQTRQGLLPSVTVLCQGDFFEVWWWCLHVKPTNRIVGCGLSIGAEEWSSPPPHHWAVVGLSPIRNCTPPCLCIFLVISVIKRICSIWINPGHNP